KMPDARRSIKVRLPSDDEARETLLRARLADDLVWSGDTSAPRYGGGMPPTIAQLYTTRFDESAWRDLYDPRFYSCVIKEISDPAALFDRRGVWSSPVQTYLELRSGDARADELAREVARYILNKQEMGME